MKPDLDNLINIFSKMSANGFNTTQPLKWGYFFVDNDRQKLETLYNELKEKDYCLIDIYHVDSNDDDWTLYVTKTEVLTPEKLHKRNIAFNELVKHYSVELYDGWDVEKVEN